VKLWCRFINTARLLNTNPSLCNQTFKTTEEQGIKHKILQQSVFVTTHAMIACGTRWRWVVNFTP